MRFSTESSENPVHHRQLEVWNKAIGLAVEVYRVSRGLPAAERYGLTQQMREAAASIAANIAEGKGRTQPRDYARFIGVARGSATSSTHTLCLFSDSSMSAPSNLLPSRQSSKKCAECSQVFCDA